MKGILLFGLLPVIFLWPGACPVATAQEPNPLWAFSDEITLGDGKQIQGLGTKGTFEPVTLDQLETVDVKVQFPASLAEALVTAQLLDGGELSSIGSATLNGDGAVSSQFHVSDQPRLYRILGTAGESKEE
jgi:hypothetical protein